MSFARNRTSGEDNAARYHYNQGLDNGQWPAQLEARFPYFSRAFDLYTGKDPLYSTGSGGPEDGRFLSSAAMPNVSSTGFLAPSYLRGTVYLKKLEEKHRAKVLAERDGSASNGTQTGPSAAASSSKLASSGSASHLPTITMKVSGSTHRGVAYEVVEKPMYPAEEDDDTVSPLPSRWNKDDKEAALEVLGDGYEVRHTGKASSEHEASAVRADHHMSPSCGVYYFEITILNKKKDNAK
jgi:hypothetical protein